MTKKLKKEKPLFNADSIATRIHQAVIRDFTPLLQEYKGSNSMHPIKFGIEAQLSGLLKKYQNAETDVQNLTRETFKAFEGINQHMLNTNLKILFWNPIDLHGPVNRCADTMEKIHKSARAIVHFVLGSFCEDEWFSECRNSSGTSIGVPFSDTSDESKFTFPMSSTVNAKLFFDRYLLFDKELSNALLEFNRAHPLDEKVYIVEGSRATTVDKTNEKRRMICVEPTVNMFLQQGLMHMLYKRLKFVGLDVETLPERHKRLAKISSITGENATIDWSSASDCVSIELLRWLLPPRWFDIIDRTRSTCTFIEGKRVDLHMISTMGNAVTFPLETLVFWAYAHATKLRLDKDNSLFPKWEDLKSVSVFGDDCIVPSYIAECFIHVMQDVGFIINTEKSYYGTEQFRESCGGDYYAGYDVRPYYLKAPTDRRMSSLEPWLYIVLNSLLKKYIQYFGELSYMYDKELFKYLFHLFRKHKINIKLVPSYFPDDSGAKYAFDILRFRSCYPGTYSRISVTENGSVSFSFCRYVYRKTRCRHDGIRYAIWLKRPFRSDRQIVNSNLPIRKRGGYVVAKAMTGHWSVFVRSC